MYCGLFILRGNLVIFKKGCHLTGMGDGYFATGGGTMVSHFGCSSLAVINGSVFVSAKHLKQEAFKRQILRGKVKLSMFLIDASRMCKRQWHMSTSS